MDLAKLTLNNPKQYALEERAKNYLALCKGFFL